MVAAFFAGKRWANKGSQNQTMYAEPSPWPARERDTKTATIHDDGLENPATHRADFSVATSHLAIQGSNAASVGYFKPSFVSHYRKPSFGHPTILPFVDL